MGNGNGAHGHTQIQHNNICNRFRCDGTYDKVTPRRPSTGTMIRLKKSVLFRRISCTMLCRSSSSCSTSLMPSLTFALAELAISQEHCQAAGQSPDFSPLYAWRISTPSKRKSLLCRKSSSSTLCGVLGSHLPSVPKPFHCLR